MFLAIHIYVSLCTMCCVLPWGRLFKFWWTTNMVSCTVRNIYKKYRYKKMYAKKYRSVRNIYIYISYTLYALNLFSENICIYPMCKMCFTKHWLNLKMWNWITSELLWTFDLLFLCTITNSILYVARWKQFTNIT